MMYVCCCTENTTTLSTRCRRGLGGRTIAWNAKKHTTTRIGTSVNQNTLVACVRKRLACTSHPTQDSVRNVLVYFAIVLVSRIINKARYCTYCKEVIRNHECFVEVEKKIENKSWRYVFL